MYDQAAAAEIILVNTGKVGFEFNGIDVDPGLSPRPKVGVPIMVPQSVGYLHRLPYHVLNLTV